MNQDNWGMCENHGYNHYSNNSCDDEFYNNGCDYGNQYETQDNDWQWTDNSGQNQYQESSFFPENQESPFFPESQYQETQDNDWQWTDNPGQNQYQESPSFEPQENPYQESPYYSDSLDENQESPYFSENHDSLDECSSAERLDEMLEMMDMMTKSIELQESLANIQRSVEYMSEQLNQPPPDNISDTTQLEEVSFRCHDEPFNDKEHEPTPPLVEVGMKDYVSLDDTDSESDFENNEVVTDLEKFNEPFHDLETTENRSETTHENDVSFPFSDNLTDTKMHEPTPPEPELEVVVEDYVPLNDKKTENEEVEIGIEQNQIKLYEPIIPKVGEGLVEVKTTSAPTTLSKPTAQPFVVTEFKSLFMYKKVKDFINRPFLTTIHVQISRHKSAIDVIFENQKLQDILFSPTNDPPITGDLLVINTIDDYVHEHTANMLSDTTRTLENCLPCNRSRMLHNVGNPLAKRKWWKKKQDFIFTRRSKAKGRGYKKRRAMKFCRKNYSQCSKTRLRCSSAEHKAKRLGIYSVKEGIPFDPGGSQITYKSL